MKVGDKLYCKKEINNTSIKKGGECIIEYIDGDRITITYNNQTKLYLLNLFYSSENNVHEFFYTEKQMRKLKLKKIYEINLR